MQKRLRCQGSFNLLDMLRVNAYHYVRALELLAEIQHLIDVNWFNSSEPISQDAVERILATLPALSTHCDVLNLETTNALIVEFLNGYEVFSPTPHPSHAILKRGSIVGYLYPAPTRRDAAIRIECIRNTFEKELQTRLFTFILPHRARFFSDETLGPEIAEMFVILEKFEDARFDLIEAGNCFAAERFTACVYHLMRVAEYALVSVAASANVPEEKRTSWDKMIQGIESKSNWLSSNKPPNWQEDVKKYNELCSWFTFMQKGWRNPVSHVPRFYSENTAKGMFPAVQTIFTHLIAVGIKQAPMPKTAIALPDPGD